jgi:hypothetical protein
VVRREIRSVTRILWARVFPPSKFTSLGDGVIDNAACQNGRTGVHDDDSIRRPHIENGCERARVD